MERFSMTFCRGCPCDLLFVVTPLCVCNIDLFRHAPMKKITNCKNGGFRSLKVKLLDPEAKLECTICAQMLEACKFDEVQMDRVITEWLQGTWAGHSSKLVPPPKKGADVQPEAAVNDAKAEKCECQGDSEDELIDARTVCMTYLQQLEGTFKPLPAGSFGRKCPLQCLVCTSPTWPTGQVLELSRWTVDCARHFVAQHCDSMKHQRALAKLQAGHIQVEHVDCQGLCVNDEERACHLYRFREEFRLWAVHSNFEGSAKHSYHLDKNIIVWERLRRATWTSRPVQNALSLEHLMELLGSFYHIFLFSHPSLFHFLHDIVIYLSGTSFYRLIVKSCKFNIGVLNAVHAVPIIL